MAADLCAQPQASIPGRTELWGQTLATYRFLGHAQVTPQAVQTTAIECTRQECAERSVVLCLHDLTELKPVYRMSDTKLLQHTALAVDGDVIVRGIKSTSVRPSWSTYDGACR